MNVTGTFQKAITHIASFKARSAFVLHTGDVSHLSKADQYDAVNQVIKGAKIDEAYYAPGEHDTFVDRGQAYLSRFGQGTTGNGDRDRFAAHRFADCRASPWATPRSDRIPIK